MLTRLIFSKLGSVVSMSFKAGLVLLGIVISIGGFSDLVIAKLTGSLSEDAITERLRPVGKVKAVSGGGVNSGITSAGVNSGSNIAGGATSGGDISANNMASSGTNNNANTLPAPAKIFQNNCKMCHQTGLAGAPRFGNKEDWAPRIAQGMDELLDKAFHGFKGMPPKGNCLDCTKEDIKATIEYMLNAVK